MTNLKFDGQSSQQHQGYDQFIFLGQIGCGPSTCRRPLTINYDGWLRRESDAMRHSVRFYNPKHIKKLADAFCLQTARLGSINFSLLQFSRSDRESSHDTVLITPYTLDSCYD